MKLGTLLLRNATIGLSQLESALRNQVLYGGRLGTNLVELGLIDLELLSAYLAELTGCPFATAALLDGADPELLARLGSDDAHRLRAIPLGWLDDASGAIAVAVVEPANEQLLGELRDGLAAEITPYVVPELRILYYLEKHFGTPRRARFVRSASAGADSLVGLADVGEGDRRRSQPAHGMVMPPALTLEPRRKRTSQIPTIEDKPAALAITYGAACERIDTATHREQIADALVDYAKGRCDALVIFLVRDGNALGWCGYLANAATTQIAELSLPLGGASSLQSAHDTGQPFVGVAPSAARPVETMLWTALGATPDSAAVVVIPILVKQRAVNLIYAHSHAGPPAAAFVAELTDLANRVQTSFLRLIRQARGS